MKKFIFFIAAMSALLSCVKENPVADTPVVDTPVVETPAEETFCVELKATAPSDGDDAVAAHSNTKTTLVGGVDAEGKPKKFVHWSKGDAIKVLLFPNTVNHNAAFDGPSGVFVSNFSQESAKSAGFRCDSWSWGSKVTEQGITKSLQPDGIAIYPATATATSSKPNDKYVNANTEVSFTLPSNQNAVKDNIESNLNFSYANVSLTSIQQTVENGADTDVTFNNACAMIELTMPSTLDKKVTSISLISNTAVPLTGKGTVKLTGYKNIIASPFGVDVTEGGGVVLNNANGFEAGAKYYVVVWPGYHGSGLTIEFAAEDGTKATKTTGKVELTASHVKPYSFNKGLVFESSTYDYVYSDGTFGNEVKSNIVGVVIYNGNPKEKFNDPDLPDQYCNGLAIGTKNVVTTWGGSSSFTVPSGVKTSPSNFGKGGYSAKKIITDAGKNLPIYTNSSYGDLSLCNTSGWYIGTNKEWDYILSIKNDINALLEAAGCDLIQFATQSGNSAAIWLPLLSGNYVYLAYTNYYGDTMQYGTNTSIWYYSSTRVARPIFAF